MVYYVEDEKEKGWSIPIQVKPRDLYDMGEDDEEIIYDNEGYPSQDLEQFFPNDVSHIQLARDSIDDDLPNSFVNENVVGGDNEDMVF